MWEKHSLYIVGCSARAGCWGQSASMDILSSMIGGDIEGDVWLDETHLPNEKQVERKTADASRNCDVKPENCLSTKFTCEVSFDAYLTRWLQPVSTGCNPRHGQHSRPAMRLCCQRGWKSV